MAQLKRPLFSYDIETTNPLWYPIGKQLSFFFLDEVKNMPHDNTQVKIDLLRKQISALDLEFAANIRELHNSINKLELEVKTVRETKVEAKPLSPFSMTPRDLHYRIWRTSDGREIEFSKLATPHLKNCIEYCYDVLRERNGNFLLVRSYLNSLTKEYAMRQDR